MATTYETLVTSSWQRLKTAGSPTIVATIAALLLFHQAAVAEWAVETVTDEKNRQITRALLHEIGGRATIVIQCAHQTADVFVYLRDPAGASHLQVLYRFDDHEPQTRMVAVSPSGHVLRIWNEADKHAFSQSLRLRIQTRPLIVFDFDLRGIETIASKLNC